MTPGRLKALRAMAIANKEAKLNRKVRVGKKTRTELDITYGELEEYQKSQVVCEICGRAEKINSNPASRLPQHLAIDHDHDSNKFRGLLCYQCNIQLGWYEKHRDSIEKYLSK